MLPKHYYIYQYRRNAGIAFTFDAIAWLPIIMSLKKKIALSFFISAFIIAVLSAAEYINFINVSKEIRNLETADTMRSQLLQLRRHEKNFFLYPEKAADEADAVYRGLDEMDRRISRKIASDKTGSLLPLKDMLNTYHQQFRKIEVSISSLADRFSDYPLLRLAFREHPLQAAEFLSRSSAEQPGRQLINDLRVLDAEIQALRKDGEDLLGYAKELDKDARENAERVIRMSQTAILVVFPLFLISGIGTLFFMSRNIVNRLRLLTGSVEKAGKGQFSQVAFLPHTNKWGEDEVGVLMKEFNTMEDQIAERMRKKNEELQQSKKLAAIGTLASGVAHELNNPLR